MERRIRKSGKIFSKFFRTVTFYISMTLAVFFGYVMMFGNVPPIILELNRDQTTASSAFSDFVANMMSFKNIDTDFEFTFENEDEGIDLTISGDFAFDLQTNHFDLISELLFYLL